MDRPNIIYILADDMGYGDAACNNPDSKIPTPNLDRMARQGMRFTDAHAASAVCTPSRYNILTGRYCWRSALPRGIVWEWDAPVIESGRPTVADYLRSHGYRTACIGKWHLGWDWPTLDGRRPNETIPYGTYCYPQRTEYEANIDYRGRIRGGPVERGFDSYFGVDVPNFPPYAWFDNDRLTEQPAGPKPATMYGNPGMAVPGWSLEAMLPEFTRRAVDLIERHAKPGSPPFFLYLPLTSPHAPIVPNAAFRGMSKAGPYGDLVCETDWVLGQVLDALDRTGTRDNTLVIFTSDNGPENYDVGDVGAYERIRRHEHSSMSHFRGVKREVWEGGHRVPFVATWPKAIPQDAVCDQLVCLGDLFASCAEILGETPPAGAAEDSVSILPLWCGDLARPAREHLVLHSCDGRFAVRRGPWVFIDAPTADENGEPDWFKTLRGYADDSHPGQLFNLADDPSQRVNRFAQHPDLVAELSGLIRRVRGLPASG